MSDNDLWEAGERKTAASVVGSKQPGVVVGGLGFLARVGSAVPGDPVGITRPTAGKAACPGGVLLSGEGLRAAGGGRGLGRLLGLYSHLTLL